MNFFEIHLLDIGRFKQQIPAYKKTGWVRYLLADTLAVFPQASDQMQVAGHCILITLLQEDIACM